MENKTLPEILGLNTAHKLTLFDAISIRKTTAGKLTDLPWRIIHKLFTSDYKGRDDPILEVGQFSMSTEDDNETFYDLYDNDNNASDYTNESSELSTLDVLVTLFDFSDSLLKQALAQKLFLCKLAIPFLYPQAASHKMMLSLWALRTIEVDGLSVTDTPIPIVTFLRLGELPRSKSKMMNDLLNDNNHHTFVNYQCPNGTVKRILSDGLVECSWFVKPSKEYEYNIPDEGNKLPCTTMFLNLRGDAFTLEKQCQLLCKISSVIVILATAKGLATQYSDAYQNIYKSAENVVLVLFLETGSIRSQQKELDQLKSNLGKEILDGTILVLSKVKHGRQKSDRELMVDISKVLVKHLAAWPRKTLQECFVNAHDEFVTVDEYINECLKGKKLAENVIDPLLKEPVESRKRNMLPLQEDGWNKHSKLMKEQHRLKTKEEQTIYQQSEQIKQKMKNLRNDQVSLYKKMSVTGRELINLTKSSESELHFSLIWIKKALDKESRANMKDLRKKYSKKWEECQNTRENDNDKSKIKAMCSEVEDLEKNLVAPSIGLEHFFRELGQIYEAVHESKLVDKNTKSQTENLPYIAAKLLLNGYPLELLDGDASGLPLTWIKAVFSHLKQLTKDTPIFVISVLGIQSSGKSTLLNTMLGLHFEVSAGKCTRGAFMQLVPVDESTGLSYRHILVIDTEGLRAPEQGSIKYIHDNELATFAVGLANVTLINIKGENTAEIRDVLQIVVHAFLRMKAANLNKQSKRTCMFIHQNVSETNAPDMNMHGRHKFLELLDNMTKLAAESEDIADVSSFRHIINFDMQKHVWYLPDLWLGNPPMAPANPSYSQKIEKVRDCLLYEMKEYVPKMFLKPSDLFIHIKDVWNGILCEDFVFSFRNTLELKTYVMLESKYNELVFEMQEIMMLFVQTEATKRMESCKEYDELSGTASKLIAEISEIVKEKVAELKQKLESYFKSEENGEIVAQWKYTMFLSLENEGWKLKEEKEAHLNKMIETCRVKLLQSHVSSTHLDDIIKQAISLGHKIKMNKMTEEEMEKTFDNIWTPFIDNHQITKSSRAVNIHVIIEKALQHYTKWPGMREELKKNNLKIPLPQASLPENIDIEDITKELVLRSQWFLKAIGWVLDYGWKNAKQYIYNQTISILKNADKCLRDSCKPHEPFQSQNVDNLFHSLKKNVESLREELDLKKQFTLSQAYECKLALLVGRHALHYFEKAQEEYINNYSVQANIRRYKASTYNTFKSTVNQSAEEVIAADFFCDELEKVILHTVPGLIAAPLIGSVLSGFRYNKYHLLIQVLEDLAKNENFKDYKAYIKNKKLFATNWLKKLILKKLNFCNDTGCTQYFLNVKEELYTIFQDVNKCTSEATEFINMQQQKTLMFWAEIVCMKIDTIPLAANNMKLVTDRLVSNYNNLQRILEERFAILENKLNNTFKRQAAKDINWPEGKPWREIMKSLWGCPEQCPFCGEPCSKTSAKHDGTCHTCIQHTPQGTTGHTWKDTNELLTTSCGFDINADNAFVCGACNFKCRENGKCTTTGTDWVLHKYREYKKYIPDWDIQPDPTNSRSKYWMWFMAKFKHELSKLYKCNVSDIPASWDDITKEEALEDLRSMYTVVI